MGGKSSRDKGHGFERAVARVLRVLWSDARRGKQYTGGRECDVEGTPLRIECKRQKAVTVGDIKKAIAQAESDAYEWEDDRPVIAITRADREQAYVTMKLSTAVTIVQKLMFRPPDVSNVIPFERKD